MRRAKSEGRATRHSPRELRDLDHRDAVGGLRLARLLRVPVGDAVGEEQARRRRTRGSGRSGRRSCRSPGRGSRRCRRCASPTAAPGRSPSCVASVRNAGPFEIGSPQAISTAPGVARRHRDGVRASTSRCPRSRAAARRRGPRRVAHRAACRLHPERCWPPRLRRRPARCVETVALRAPPEGGVGRRIRDRVVVVHAHLEVGVRLSPERGCARCVAFGWRRHDEFRNGLCSPSALSPPCACSRREPRRPRCRRPPEWLRPS